MFRSLKYLKVYFITYLIRNIDSALLRRLEKQIYVTLPNLNSRLDLFKLYVSPDVLSEEDDYALLHATNNCSAADIKLVCKEAWIKQSISMWNHLYENH